MFLKTYSNCSNVKFSWFKKKYPSIFIVVIIASFNMIPANARIITLIWDNDNDYNVGLVVRDALDNCVVVQFSVTSFINKVIWKLGRGETTDLQEQQIGNELLGLSEWN